MEGLGYAEDGPNGAITDGTLNNKTGSKRPFDSQDNPRASKRNVYEVIDDRAGPADDDDAPAIGVTAEEEDDWQDKDEYALAQTEGTLDMLEEDRHPGAHLEQPTNPEEEEELVNIEIEETGEKVDPRKQRGRDGDGGTARRKSQAESAMSKEERKRQKKMRQKEIRTNINEEKRKKASKE